MLQGVLGRASTVATAEKANRCPASHSLPDRQRVEAAASVSRSQNHQVLEVRMSWKLMPLELAGLRENFLLAAGHISVHWPRDRSWCCRFADL